MSEIRQAADFIELAANVIGCTKSIFVDTGIYKRNVLHIADLDIFELKGSEQKPIDIIKIMKLTEYIKNQLEKIKASYATNYSYGKMEYDFDRKMWVIYWN